MGTRQMMLLRAEGFFDPYKDEIKEIPANDGKDHQVLKQLVYLIQKARDAFVEQHPNRMPKGMELQYPDFCRFLSRQPDLENVLCDEEVAGEMEAIQFFSFNEDRIYQLAEAIALDIESGPASNDHN